MKKKLILYVEDDDATALLVRIALEEAGGQVQCTRISDVDDALRFLSSEANSDDGRLPQLILLDINLPRKSGFEVLRSVRKSTLLGQIPVVVFTSSAAPGDRNNAIALGATAYMRKPSTFEDYVTAMRDVIGMMVGEQAPRP